MKKSYIFFDIDNTLYPVHFDTNTFIGKRAIEFYKKKGYNFSYDYLTKLYLKHGTSVKGVFVEENIEINFIEFLDFISIGCETCLKYSEEEKKDLIQMFKSMRERKGEDCSIFTFTNGSTAHQDRILGGIGLGGTNIFDGHISSNSFVEHGKFLCKPDERVFELVHRILGIDRKDGGSIFFVEDSKTNIKVARKFGWNCIYVGEKDHEDEEVKSIRNIFEFEKIFEEFILPKLE